MNQVQQYILKMLKKFGGAVVVLIIILITFVVGIKFGTWFAPDAKPVATTQAAVSDSIDDTVDYKALTKKIIEKVENSSFFLIEKLTKVILDIVMEDPLVEEASVKVDKPHALRFADSVSIELSEQKTS